MIILGLDASTNKTGWAVIDTVTAPPDLTAHGLIKLKQGAKWPLGRRMVAFEDEILNLLSTHQPDIIVVEAAHVKFMGAAKALFKMQGVVLLSCRKYNDREVTSITATEIRGLLHKKDKKDVREFVNKEYGLSLTENDEDISDAIAVARAGYVYILRS